MMGKTLDMIKQGLRPRPENVTIRIPVELMARLRNIGFKIKKREGISFNRLLVLVLEDFVNKLEAESKEKSGSTKG